MSMQAYSALACSAAVLDALACALRNSARVSARCSAASAPSCGWVSRCSGAGATRSTRTSQVTNAINLLAAISRRWAVGRSFSRCSRGCRSVVTPPCCSRWSLLRRALQQRSRRIAASGMGNPLAQDSPSSDFATFPYRSLPSALQQLGGPLVAWPLLLVQQRQWSRNLCYSELPAE